MGTKIPGGLNTSETLAAHAENLQQLGLDYVDHLMVHYPGDWYDTPARSNPARRQEEWLALESIYKKGEARSLGISHYCSQHIDDILEVATVRPSVNQVEYHIGSGDLDDVIQKCATERIYFMSFSSLCGPCSYEPKDSLINGDLVSSIGAAHNVSGAQVSLRWIVQQSLTREYIGPVIPKSNNADHIASNIDLFNDGFTRQRLDKDLHATTQAQHQVQGAFLLDVVVRKCPAILELLACENQTLLIRRDAFLILDLGFHVVNGVGRLNVQRDGFTRQRLDKDLHSTT